MAGVVSTQKPNVSFVGGRGTKAGDANAGGGCTKEYWGNLDSPDKALSDVMGTNGEPVSDATAWNGSQSACVVSDNGSGYTRVTKSGCFGSCEVGHIANIQFNLPVNHGRYEVIAVNANYVDLDCTTMVTGTADIKVGGAFDKLQTASDNTTANAAATPQNAFILDNKAEVFTGVGDQIDLDVGGGSPNGDTKKVIVAVDNNGVENERGSRLTINGNGQACHVFRIYDVDSIELRHIYAYNSNNSYYGFYISGSNYHQGFLLNDCESTDCKYGLYSDTQYIRGITVLGGYYESIINSAMSIFSSRWVHLQDIIFKGSYASEPIIDCDIVGTLRVQGCIFYRETNFDTAIKLNSYDTFLYATHNVFYDINYPIVCADVDSRIVSHSNIFVLHTMASMFYFMTAGAVVYSDYNCGWSLEGAPTNIDRWGNIGLGPNSIEADPKFRNGGNRDFRLMASSPCVNTGRPTLGALN